MSNLNFLTRSHTAIAAKRRQKKAQITEILFDDTARREFLTGFHKRKLAKADAARKKAAEREKQERLESRREQRRTLRERAIENAAQVEQAYGATFDADDVDDGGENEEWSGIEDPGNEQEYQDEEVIATVAVIEDFDPDTIIHGPNVNEHRPVQSSSIPTPKPKSKPSAISSTALKKKNPKSVRYETKEARKASRRKQFTRRTEKAERAGGKSSRKPTTKRR